MRDSKISQGTREILTGAARKGFLPLNISCPCKCTFCYEANIKELFPRMKISLIPPYTSETLNFYESVYKKYKIPLSLRFPIEKIKDKLHYFPNCDFFSSGLTPSQIEKLILICKRDNQHFVAYTSGLNVDFKLIKYLTLKYPKHFRLSLSIITFDPGIRQKTMNPAIDVENLKKICAIALEPMYFLLYFNKTQLISDINILNKFSMKNKGCFFIHRLYFNRLSPAYIRNYSIQAEKEFEKIVFYLKINDKKLHNISKRLIFSPGSKIFAWAFKDNIKELLRVCKDTKDEAIFCSVGAYKVIKSLAGEKINVVGVQGCLGGCVDFSLSITLKSILNQIDKLIKNGTRLKKIHIPSTILCINGELDLEGSSLDCIKKAYPAIKINVIKIPEYVIDSVLKLDACVNYFLNKVISG